MKAILLLGLCAIAALAGSVVETEQHCFERTRKGLEDEGVKYRLIQSCDALKRLDCRTAVDNKWSSFLRSIRQKCRAAANPTTTTTTPHPAPEPVTDVASDMATDQQHDSNADTRMLMDFVQVGHRHRMQLQRSTEDTGVLNRVAHWFLNKFSGTTQAEVAAGCDFTTKLNCRTYVTNCYISCLGETKETCRAAMNSFSGHPSNAFEKCCPCETVRSAIPSCDY